MEIVRDGDSNGDGLVVTGGVFTEELETPESSFWGLCGSSGKVVKLDGETFDGRGMFQVNTRGCPTGIALDENGRVYVTDVEHGAILKVDATTGKVVTIVKDYEGKPLLGPSSIALGKDGTMYFTDSGSLGESSLDNPCGSVFAITRDDNGQILRPLLLRTLAHPCGICVSTVDDGTIYVSETLKNRVLRIAKRPHGAYISSVLHQFSGRLGPSAIACDSMGKLYVARYDFNFERGLISVIDPSGSGGGHIRDIDIPEIGSEITDLVINKQTNELYVFEGSSEKVIKMPIE